MDEIDEEALRALPPEIRASAKITTPFAKSMGVTLVALRPGFATLKVPYQDKLIGNPATGVIHGGVITALLDNCSGFAVFSLRSPGSIATLDLRIDYMRAAEPGCAIFADAHCYKTTRSVAFVRGTAYHETPEDPIATSAATFMLDANAGRGPGANLK
jgi:uncharacterized protein (TIGR00369 family)